MSASAIGIKISKDNTIPTTILITLYWNVFETRDSSGILNTLGFTTSIVCECGKSDWVPSSVDEIASDLKLLLKLYSVADILLEELGAASTSITVALGSNMVKGFNF